MPYRNLELEIDTLLSDVVEHNASDLHLIPGHPPIFRVDGRLTPRDEHEILSVDQIENIAQIFLDAARYKVLQEKKEFDFSYSFKDSNRFRINAYYQKGVLALALRFVPKTIRTIEELNLPPILTNFADRKQGLVLVVGPTGHGKSTTLAAMIDYINHNRAEHIITVEDPIEYLFTPQQSFIQQREVGLDTFSFANAIRATLREDANVVMVGEMRDFESISATMTVAETGHLVFATLHTNDAAQTIDRIIDTFPPDQQQQIRAQLSATLVSIVSLRLLPQIGGGRVLATEVMIANDAVRNIIRENRTYEMINTIHTGGQEGMISLDQSLAMLVAKRQVRIEDAKGYIQYPSVFEARLKGVSGGIPLNQE
ncbi:MAG: type IV pili twitching motility protein PilT [Candidatus Doudnabacteria bacterium RIFCSPHIGHO2_02_FULL_46_11]|uniref:Type IV pili twitching motility protein PilT n=1 Tax=Candidatus Doudnabacteria bacterium RIFCSPHIGHO2_02_FULL_46_11 TaxID=1817832 RepID=A0A1F5P8A4_9BACT|nr:MAG: type IV pili twitching motility protein PilT [Candidatus Doudnabacteria bacterium RIFCSPHIGHO2_02_FULL_46_11]